MFNKPVIILYINLMKKYKIMSEFSFRMKRRNIYSNFRFYLYENCSVIEWIIWSKVCNVRALQLTLCRVSIVSIGFTRTIVTVFSSRCRRSMIRCFPMILCDPAYRLAMRIFQGQPERIYIYIYQAIFFTVTISRGLYFSCLVMLYIKYI